MSFSATVTNLQQKVETLTTANTLMKEDLAIAKNNLLELQQENSVLRGEKETLLEQHKSQIEVSLTPFIFNFLIHKCYD